MHILRTHIAEAETFGLKRCFQHPALILMAALFMEVVASSPSLSAEELSEVEGANIETISRVFSAINNSVSGSDETFASVVRDAAAPSFIRHDLTGIIPGIEGHDGARDFITQLKKGFSDLELKIIDMIASNDKVVVYFITVGTNDGPFLAREPTFKTIDVNNINIYRLEDGRVIETWQLYDALSLMQQLDY